MKTLKRIVALLGMALGAGAVWVAFSLDRVFSSAPGFFQWGTWRDYAFVAAVALLGLAVIVVAYCFGFRWGAEPTASPLKGGPATHSGNSGVTGGPPSVS
jgi:hypothetical protein